MKNITIRKNTPVSVSFLTEGNEGLEERRLQIKIAEHITVPESAIQTSTCECGNCNNLVRKLPLTENVALIFDDRVFLKLPRR